MYHNNNFYPRSPCGERPATPRAGRQAAAISIHALLAESDAVQLPLPNAGIYFYPRSPCGERPDTFKRDFTAIVISIHALLAESDPWQAPAEMGSSISIHALLAESDRALL